MQRRNDGIGRAHAVLVATALSVVPSFHLSAQALANNSGALFLLFPVGAQAVAMGQTAATLEGRGEAAFWNPAGLATLEHSEFALNTASLAAGATHALTAYYPSHGFGVLGGAVLLVDYGDLERTDSADNTIARIAPRNIEFLASYATELGGSVALGINYKLVEFVVDCSGDCGSFPNGHGVTHAVDVGGQFTVGPAGALRVAVAVKNVGFKLQVNNRDQADALPARLVVGAAYRILLPGASGLAQAERLDLKVAADVDSPWGSYGDSEMRVGIDVGYQRLLRLRGGYAFVRDGLSGPSVGMGERVDRRGPGARLPDGLRLGRPESDLFLLPRGVLRCAASPAPCCSRPPWCRGAVPPLVRCPIRASPQPRRRPRRAVPRPGCGPRHRWYSPARDSCSRARTVDWCTSRSSCTRSRASFS